MPTKTLPRFLSKTSEGTPEDFDDDPVENKDGFIELISCLPSGERLAIHHYAHMTHSTLLPQL